MATPTAPLTPDPLPEVVPVPVVSGPTDVPIEVWRLGLDPANSERHDTEDPGVEQALINWAVEHPENVSPYRPLEEWR